MTREEALVRISQPELKMWKWKKKLVLCDKLEITRGEIEDIFDLPLEPMQILKIKGLYVWRLFI